MVSDRERLVSAWRAEHQRPVVGWDFSELAGRYVEQQPPWSYDDLARDVLTGAKSALDMGTGGGEVLSRLLDVLPADTMATEGWPPNLPVARAALEPHGVEVVAYDAERDRSMPFDDGRFDVVLNRHEAYDAAEVHRILGSGGRFLTQQVDGRDFEETQQLFGHHSAYPHITLAKLCAQAEAAGLAVEQAREWRGKATFADVATLVRYFAYVPWQVPDDFTVDRYADSLLTVHASGRPLTFTQRRFHIVARRA